MSRRPQSTLVELLSSATNHAIVRLPSRRFPGIVVQGDTLSSWVELGRAILARAETLADAELEDEACELVGLMEAAQRHYEDTLSVYGIDLPYAKKA